MNKLKIILTKISIKLMNMCDDKNFGVNNKSESVDDTKGRLLIDSGNTLNLVSTTYINSLPVTYEQVSICRGLIY